MTVFPQHPVFCMQGTLHQGDDVDDFDAKRIRGLGERSLVALRADATALDKVNFATSAALIRQLRVPGVAPLNPVTNNEAGHEAMQECATMQGANPSLSHSPPMTWRCYTAGGAAAAGRANLSWGRRSSAATVSGYMHDPGTPSLGHRRWLLNGSLGRVAVGFRDRAGCLGVFDWSGSASRPWAAYPTPGPAPSGLTSHTWSVQGNLPGTDVQVTRLSDGMELSVEGESLRGGFGSGSTVAIHRRGWSPEVGERYRVVLSGSRGRIEYTVEPVDCR